MSLEEILEAGLSGVDLSSRSPSKFDRLTAALGEHFGTDGLVVKALGDAKNFGNRISEASGAGAQLLVLLGSSEVDPQAVQRAYAARAVRRIPTLLVLSTEVGWRPQIAFTGGENPFPESIPVVWMYEAENTFRNSDHHATIHRLLSLNGASVAELEALERSGSFDQQSIVVKHVSDAKNLLNRVREAVGRHPAVLVSRAPVELADKLRTALQAHGDAIGATVMALVDGDTLQMELVTTLTTTTDPEETLALPFAAEEAPAYHVNRTVDELNRYLPFNASAQNLYEEHITVGQRLEIETKALGFIRALLAKPDVSMVVLTGNAGHGKTHLCRRLLTEAGATAKDAMEAMSRDLTGSEVIELPGLARRVRILKDLSEIEPASSAGQRLEELLRDQDTLAIVCANEGRLRHVVSTRPSTLGILVETLEAGIRRGVTSIAPSVHVVNLNFQAVAPRSEGAFLEAALDHWGHGNRWRKCTSCLAADACPILANRNALSPGAERQRAVRPARDALAHLVRLAEQTGYVLTIREALLFVAYLLTGGLDCKAVHRRHPRQELEGFDYQRSLFERELPENDLAQLGVVRSIRRFDPGRTAIRTIDERLHRDLERNGSLGDSVLEVASAPPSTRDQLKREQVEHREQIRRARRADYFVNGGAERLSLRLGLLHHDDFLSLQGRSVDEPRMLAILDRLIQGLHVVQGIRVSGDSAGVLFLVDPAFSRGANRSAVIAHQFDQTSLELVGEATYWEQTDGAADLLGAVDWLDRRIVLAHRADDSDAPVPILDFDLLQFEFVMRAATGVVFEDFNSAERKRIVGRLARLAEENRTARREIRVMENGTLRRLILERDNSFRVATIG